MNRIIRSIDQNHNHHNKPGGKDGGSSSSTAAVKYHRHDIRKRAFRIKSTGDESSTNDSHLSFRSGFESSHASHDSSRPSTGGAGAGGKNHQKNHCINNNYPSSDSPNGGGPGIRSSSRSSHGVATPTIGQAQGPHAVPTTRQIARIRFANLLIGMTCSFIFCWAPYNLISLWVDLFPDESWLPYLSFALLLGHSHSAINPVIYWYLNKASRAKLRHLVQSRTQLIQMKRMKTKTDMIYLQSNLPPPHQQLAQARAAQAAATPYQHAHQRLTMDTAPNGTLKGSIAMLAGANSGARIISENSLGDPFPGRPPPAALMQFLPKNCTRL